MEKKKKIIFFVVICIAALFVIVLSSGVLGVPARNIEQDARRNQKIDRAWAVSIATNDRLGAMLFYNEMLDDYVYSIYVNREGFSFGYFFRSGGSASSTIGSGDSIMDGVHGFAYGTNGSAIISMNKSRVAEISLDNGIHVTRIDIDPTKPFAAVIPVNVDSVALYDVNGDVVPFTVIEIVESA